MGIFKRVMRYLTLVTLIVLACDKVLGSEAATSLNVINGSNSIVIRHHNKKLVNEFLEELQNESQLYFEDMIVGLESLEECLDKAELCKGMALVDVDTGENTVVDFEQEDLVIYLQDTNQQFRTYVGLRDIHRIKKQQRFLHGIPGAEPMPFYPGIKGGRDEMANLFNESRKFNKVLKSQLAGMEETEAKEIRNEMLMQENARLNTIVSDFARRFPFLLKIKTARPDREELRRSMEAAKFIYHEEKINLSELEGNHRFRILGFIPIVSRTMDKMEPGAADDIIGIVADYQNNVTVKQRLIDIATNTTTILIASCHAVTFTFVVIRWASLVCGSWGLYKSLPAFYSNISDMYDYKGYSQTGAFSGNAYQEQKKYFIASTIMSLVYLRGAVPGFFHNVKTFKRRSRVAIGNLKRGRILKLNKKITDQAKELSKSYANYYSKDMTVQEVASNKAGLEGTIDLVGQYFGHVVNRSAAGSTKVLRFYSLLEVSPLLARH